MICIPIKGMEDKLRVTTDSRQIKIEQAVKQKDEIVWIFKLSHNSIGELMKSVERRMVFSDSDTKKIIRTLEEYKEAESEYHDAVKNLVSEMEVNFKDDILVKEKKIEELEVEIDSLKKKLEYERNKAKAK